MFITKLNYIQFDDIKSQKPKYDDKQLNYYFYLLRNVYLFDYNRETVSL